MLSFYELRMLNKMSEYNINKNAQNMLRSHDEWKLGHIDECELGRRVRMSRENRAAVIQTMVKIASIMQKKPEESKYVLNIIEMCGQILSIAGKSTSSVSCRNIYRHGAPNNSSQTSLSPKVASPIS
jgi:hypothetical protein